MDHPLSPVLMLLQGQIRQDFLVNGEITYNSKKIHENHFSKDCRKIRGKAMSKTKLLSDGDETLEVVDKDGNVLGLAKRSEIHGNPSLVHRVVHVLVFNSKGDLLLQKRSMNKDVAPGTWDTSVGGHVNPGEDIPEAARREMKEELGIADCRLDY